MVCERCGVKAEGYALFDYCAVCGRNLCDACMQRGCCGNAPVSSGENADHQDSSDPLDDDRDQNNPADYTEYYDWSNYDWDNDPDWR